VAISVYEFMKRGSVERYTAEGLANDAARSSHLRRPKGSTACRQACGSARLTELAERKTFNHQRSQRTQENTEKKRGFGFSLVTSLCFSVTSEVNLFLTILEA